MAVDYTSQILEEKKIAYAIFDKDLFLTNHSSNFNKITHQKLEKGSNSLWNIFPELF